MALVAYQDGSPVRSGYLVGMIDALSNNYYKLKPGAKVALIAYQDGSPEGSGYLVRMPDALSNIFNK